MAIRCGIYKPSALIPADLVPGAKILETREGQAVTVVAAHDDDGEFQPFSYKFHPPNSAEQNARLFGIEVGCFYRNDRRSCARHSSDGIRGLQKLG